MIRRAGQPGMALALLAAAGLGLRFFYAWRSLPELLAQGMADDAFYYLAIARNIALGSGVTFDGLQPTNGFHPLYAAMLVPLARLFPERPETLAQAGLTLLMVLNAWTALPLYFLFHRRGKSWAGVMAAFVWLFNPWNLIISLGGVESGVYVFFAALSSLAYLVLRRSSGADWRQAAVTGACLGLAIAGRSDGIFLLGAILLDLGLAVDWRAAPRLWSDRRLREVVVIGGAAGIVLLPWLAWNLAVFGSPVQVSGTAVYWHTHFGKTGSLGVILGELGGSLARMGYGALFFNLPAVFLGLLAGALALAGRRHPAGQAGETPPDRGSTGFLGIYGGLIFLFYAFYLWQQQFWYFMPLLLIGAAAAGEAYSSLENKTAGLPPIARRLAPWLLAALIAAIMLTGWQRWQSGQLLIYPAQQNGLPVAAWLAANTLPEERIGAWNSGVIGYLAGRTVINLDGVVNNELMAFVRQADAAPYDLCSLWPYVRAQELDYITDYEDVWPADFEAQFSGLLELAESFPSLHDGGRYQVRIYRVLPPASSGEAPCSD
jgi:hypothetical protein